MKTKVIIVTGKAQSGKSSACDDIRTYLKGIGSSSKIYAFADKLKEVCTQLFGLTHSQCWGENADKDSPTKFKWSDLPIGSQELSKIMMDIASPSKKISQNDYMSAREVMQVWGTDIFRSFYSNCFVDATINQINEEAFDFALICDARFPNELDAFIDIDPIVLRLTRKVTDFTHSSETKLSSYDWCKFKNYRLIDNSDMTIEDKNYFIKLALEDILESNGYGSQAHKTRRIRQGQSPKV